MTGVVNIVAGAALLAGGIFAALSALGLVRLPDVASRLQAATKAQTLALVLIAIGVAPAFRPVDAPALALVVLFQLTTAPITAQLIGRAAYRDGHGREHLVSDDLSQLPGRAAGRGPQSDRR